MVRSVFCLLSICLGFVAAASAQTPTSPLAQLPSVAAKAWLLLDYQTQHLIAERNSDERVEPASLTKLMSAYVVFDALKHQQLALDQRPPISAKAVKTSGSRMFLEPGKPATVDELLRGMIVQSGNDATVTLAEAVAGSEDAFVERMNERANRLGLTATHFANATGLPDPHHYSTASDVARLATALMRDFPEYLPLYALKEYTYNGITQRNRNELLFRDPYVDGLKTGHTERAGYCLVATARRGERRLLAVVTGTASEASRAIEAQKLLNYGFQYYDTVRVYVGGAPVTEIPVWKGAEKRLKAGFQDDLYVSIPRGQSGLLEARLESMQPLIAPVSERQQVGTLHLRFDGKPYGEYPVVALESVGVANALVRAWDSLLLWLK
jgi:D-alanyl-D-alanine carboxypeptidase (penicillin-binding protein 5/6)